MDEQGESDLIFKKFKSLFHNDRAVNDFPLREQIDHLKLLDEVYWPSPTWHFIMNHNTMGYEFMSHVEGTVFGYPAEEFLEYGVRRYLEMVYLSDAELLVDVVFPDLLKFMQASQSGISKDLNFEYNYRITRNDGETINVLEQSRVLLADDRGLPLLSIGRLIQSASRSPEHTIKATIRERFDENTSETVYQKNYPPLLLSDNGLTAREIQILKELVNGKSSREIADLLSISVNTVDTHRRNMLRKMRKKSTHEMVTYALKVGI